MTKKILFVDDHAIFARSASFFVSQHCNVTAKWISESPEVLGILKNETFDLIVLDYDMPKLSGMALLKQIRKLYPELPVLMVSMHKESRLILRSIKYGAIGYVLKSADPTELVRGVESALVGKSYYCREVLNILALKYSTNEEAISERQEEVLKLTAMEFTIKEIAKKLNISTHTVISHRKNLMDKLSVKSQVGLAVFAVVNGYR